MNLKIRNIIFCVSVSILLMVSAVSVQGSSDSNPMATIRTNRGNIDVELYEDDAPETVENFIKYAEDGFYEGLIFHRVIDEFMIQGGGFYPGMEQKEPTYDPIQNEAEESGHRNERGTIAMARTDYEHSATSQFFINHDDNGFLDWDRARDGWGYCVFGRVINGMDVVDDIASVETSVVGGSQNVPVDDIIIHEVTITESGPANGDDDGDHDQETNGDDLAADHGESDPFYTDPLFIIVVGSFIAAGGVIFALHTLDKRKEQ